MDKAFIIQEIKRTAGANGGEPLGYRRFTAESGVKDYEWRRYWPSWSDALRECGLAPNELVTAYDTAELLEMLANLSREVGRIPSDGHIRVKAGSDRAFPNKNTFATRFGTKPEIVKQLAEYCRANGIDDVLAMCDRYAAPKRSTTTDDPKAKNFVAGYVYLIRSGRFHKIGKTNSTGRRERELAIQLPEKAKTVHIISTDDPTGIEAYWHKRFAEKRKNGEWFELDAADVSAFKRRKFM